MSPVPIPVTLPPPPDIPSLGVLQDQPYLPPQRRQPPRILHQPLPDLEVELVELVKVPVDKLAIAHRSTPVSVELPFALLAINCVVIIANILLGRRRQVAHNFIFLIGAACYSPSQYTCSGTTLSHV